MLEKDFTCLQLRDLLELLITLSHFIPDDEEKLYEETNSVMYAITDYLVHNSERNKDRSVVTI